MCYVYNDLATNFNNYKQMENTRESLTKLLVDERYLKTPRIIEAFRSIDRKDFVPKAIQPQAYVNAPLPIGKGQTISQPLVVAFMLELLKPEPGELVLDVGFGSGWTAALLAYIVGKKIEEKKAGKVIAIERIQELYEFGKGNIESYQFVAQGSVELINSDGSQGYAVYAPYDKIIAGAAAYGEIPDSWRDQLKIGGTIVAPIANSIVEIHKNSSDDYSENEHYGFSFVPLIRQ